MWLLPHQRYLNYKRQAATVDNGTVTFSSWTDRQLLQTEGRLLPAPGQGILLVFLPYHGDHWQVLSGVARIPCASLVVPGYA